MKEKRDPINQWGCSSVGRAPALQAFLISLAVSVYFAEPIRAVIPINLLLLLILVHIVYVLIRWYVKGCMRSRGYY